MWMYVGVLQMAILGVCDWGLGFLGSPSSFSHTAPWVRSFMVSPPLLHPGAIWKMQGKMHTHMHST